MIRVSGQSKSRPVKAAGAESCGQRRNQKLHAAVAKHTIWSQNVQNTSAPKHVLKFWCQKNGRRCGETQISKWKCSKTDVLGALFEVQMSKNCTPLWRNANFEVKMLKNRGSRGAFWSSDVEKLHAAVVKSIFGSENVQNMWCSEHFWKFRCRKVSQLASSSVNQSVR